MPHSDAYGGDEWICQGPNHQGNPIQNSRINSTWRPDITGKPGAGNVCPTCLARFEKEQENARQRLQEAYGRPEEGGSEIC